MKKILLGLAFSILISGNCYAAQEYVFNAQDYQPVYVQSAQIANLPSGEYLKFYTINTEKLAAEYTVLSKAEEDTFLKTLTKEEKENYKYVKKIQKLISEGDWNKVFSKYSNFLPAYLQYYDLCYQKGDYNQALQTLKKIKSLDRNSQIFSPELINKSFGILYFVTGQYTTALNYFKLYENSDDDFIKISLANCYYSLGNYSTAIEYCKKIKTPQYQDLELLFGSYYNIKNYSEANKYAQELLKLNYSYENLMRVQQTTTDLETKLSYCYKARAVTNDDQQIYDVNHIIADLEQNKLEKTASKITKFIKVPKWAEFEKQIPENIPGNEVSQKQDEFFHKANLYFSKYKDQDLNNALNSLNQDMTNYVQAKRNDYYMQQQVEAQKALILEQRRSNMLRQQMIREQQIQNAISRQFYFYSGFYYHPCHYHW